MEQIILWKCDLTCTAIEQRRFFSKNKTKTETKTEVGFDRLQEGTFRTTKDDNSNKINQFYLGGKATK